MKKKFLLGAGGAGLLLLLAVAAFTGGQLLQAQQHAASQNNGQAGPRKLVTPAAGVPTSAPDGRGQTQRRDGNSIFICDPQDAPERDGKTVKDGAVCSPEIEVVVGHDTELLHEASDQSKPPVKQGQDYVIQQVVEPGSAADIQNGTVVRVWGVRTGNRIVARILLYWNRHPGSNVQPGK
jgi:hypothetical protein